MCSDSETNSVSNDLVIFCYDDRSVFIHFFFGILQLANKQKNNKKVSLLNRINVRMPIH